MNFAQPRRPQYAGRLLFRLTADDHVQFIHLRPRRMNQKMMTMMAVSYTHLDVYKRQGLHDVDAARTELDVLLERVAPGQTPPGSDEAQRTRHAMRLYEETIALVVAADHELAKQPEVSLEDLALVKLLDHPDHCSGWPAPCLLYTSRCV